MIETLASEQGLAIVGLEALTIRRVRCGRGFSYRNGKGCVRDASELARLKSLAVPPAYVDVRYAADPASDATLSPPTPTRCNALTQDRVIPSRPQYERCGDSATRWA